MRLLSVRLIVSLILGVTLVSLFSTYYEVRREKHGLRNDLERRAEVLGESLVGNVEPYLDERSLKQLQRIVGRFSNREHLAGVAILNTKLEPIAQSSGLAQQLKIQSLASSRAIADNKKESQFIRLAGQSQHIYILPLHRNDEVVGELVIVHDANYIDAQAGPTTPSHWVSRPASRRPSGGHRITPRGGLSAARTSPPKRPSYPTGRYATGSRRGSAKSSGYPRTFSPSNGTSVRRLSGTARTQRSSPPARLPRRTRTGPSSCGRRPRKKRRNYVKRGNRSGHRKDFPCMYAASLETVVCLWFPTASLTATSDGVTR